MHRTWTWFVMVGLAAGWMAPVRGEEKLKGTVSLSGAWALYPMVVRWTEEFGKLQPGVRFDVSAGGAGKGMTDVLAGAVDIGLVSRDINEAELNRGALPIAVTKDAVVPMVNQKNPVLADLYRRGVKRETFQRIWLDDKPPSWGEVAGNEVNAPVRVYTRSDACGAAQTWAQFLGKAQEDLKGIGVYGDPGLGEAARRDVLAIGYNNVNYAYDAKTEKPVAGLAVVPLDVNGNGVLDPGEDFYATRKALVAAIGRGDFPSPPARELYLVTKGRPVQPAVQAFIRWALTDGQQYVAESGYIELPRERLDAGLKALEEAN